MDEIKIVKQFTKFIFPFTYDKDSIDVDRARNRKDHRIFQPTAVKGFNLREGLDELLDCGGGSTKIADCYRLDPNCRKHYDLPSNKGKPMEFFCRNSRDHSDSVSVEDIYLYLFESGVGFVDVECEYPACTLLSYENLNYFISEAKSEENYFEWEKKSKNSETGELETVTVSFTVQALLARIGKEISKEGRADVCRFLYNGTKPLMYSYLLLTDKPDNLEERIFHFAKNYKETYKFSGDVTVATLHPFENSYWAASLNGAVNVSHLTGDAITDSFFRNDFTAKLHDTYFLLFINAVHQRYALEAMLARMGELDSIGKDYYVMKEQLKKAGDYEVQAHSLKFRAFFNHPSTIEHVNAYYDMVRRVLSVNSLYNSFTTDLTNLQNICKKYVDRITETERKIARIRMINIELLVSLFGGLVGEFTLLNSSWNLIEKVAGHEISFISPAFLLVVGTLLVPLVTICWSSVKMIKELCEIKKELKEENVSDLKKKKRKEKESKSR